MKDIGFQELPAAIHNEPDLDHTVWWGMAANTAADAQALRTLPTRLRSYQPGDLYNVALLGHVCRVLTTINATDDAEAPDTE